VLDDDFEIAYSNRYDGRIETLPRKCGKRLRNRGVVTISPADQGGFFVEVRVYREQKDVTSRKPVWIPDGRDQVKEKRILDQLAKPQGAD